MTIMVNINIFLYSSARDAGIWDCSGRRKAINDWIIYLHAFFHAFALLISDESLEKDDRSQ